MRLQLEASQTPGTLAAAAFEWGDGEGQQLNASGFGASHGCSSTRLLVNAGKQIHHFNVVVVSNNISSLHAFMIDDENIP